MKKIFAVTTTAFFLAVSSIPAMAGDNTMTFRFHQDASLKAGSENMENGNFEKARRDLRRALRHNLATRERLAAANNLCITEQHLDNLPAALKACKEAVKTDRHSWQAHLNLGNVQIAMGDRDGAIKSWRRAVAKSEKAGQSKALLLAVRGTPSSRLALAGE